MRYADKRDAGECPIKNFVRNVFFFVITAVYGEIGTCSKHRGKWGDP